MTENNKSHNEVTSQSSQVMSRPSLFRTLENVKAQVEFEYFAREVGQGSGKFYTDPIYNELCLIMAEVYVKPPNHIIRIRGEKMEAAIVQEVYRALECDHIKQVAEKFKEQTQLIHKKTPYLQTALYNVLFEHNASAINELRNAGVI